MQINKHAFQLKKVKCIYPAVKPSVSSTRKRKSSTRAAQMQKISNSGFNLKVRALFHWHIQRPSVAQIRMQSAKHNYTSVISLQTRHSTVSISKTSQRFPFTARSAVSLVHLQIHAYQGVAKISHASCYTLHLFHALKCVTSDIRNEPRRGVPILYIHTVHIH